MTRPYLLIFLKLFLQQSLADLARIPNHGETLLFLADTLLQESRKPEESTKGRVAGRHCARSGLRR